MEMVTVSYNVYVNVSTMKNVKFQRQFVHVVMNIMQNLLEVLQSLMYTVKVIALISVNLLSAKTTQNVGKNTHSGYLTVIVECARDVLSSYNKDNLCYSLVFKHPLCFSCQF